MSIRFLLTLVALVFIFAAGTPASAAGTMIDLGGIKEAKTVWDVSTGDEKNFNLRMGLIRQTAEGFRKKGITPKFIVLIRGGASKFITKTLIGTKFEKSKKPVKDMGQAQANLKALVDAGIPVRSCGIARKGTKISSANVIEYIDQVDNSFENLIALQIKGYAYMEVE
ncbi:MAG: DsrE family protein [Rhodospirillales bacterium]|nr:DsrE family protein [Rhodospirillales bacterium]